MRDRVVFAAEKLGLVDKEGGLKPLDSLNIIDLVVEIESSLSVNIPSAMLMPRHFASFEAILAMLDELQS